MHKSPTELAQNPQWRIATASRLGATPDAGPRSTCALRKGNDGDMCEQTLAPHQFQCILLQVRGIEQAGGATQTRSDMSLSSATGCKRTTKRHAVMRCAILDVVSWFPGVLQQPWIDVSVRCPHEERYNESASKPGAWLQLLGKRERTKRCGMAVRALVFETCGRVGNEGTKLLRDLVNTPAANVTVQPACCWQVAA